MSLYDDITTQLANALERGIVPWRCPFERCSLPTNYKTKQAYNGMNTIILWLGNLMNGYTSHYWIGFNQAKQLKGKVKKGAKATRIIACITNKKDEENEVGNDIKNVVTHFFRAEYVFNLDQVEGIEFDTTSNFEEISSLDDMVQNSGATIRYQGERAFYSTNDDYINMPLKSKFKDTEGYYSTLLHELVHWTGAKTRLDRFEGNTEQDRAFEELIAEIGASFICAQYGISPNIDNNSSYINSWLQALQGDKSYFFKAVKKANAAAKFLTNSKI